MIPSSADSLARRRSLLRWLHPINLLVVIIFLISQLVITLVIVSHSSSNPLCPSPPPEEIALTRCDPKGIQGPLNPAAVATIVLAMKGLSKNTYNSGGLHHLKFIMHSRTLIRHDVNFVVMTSNCFIAQLARQLGFATIHPESGSAAGDLTYNHAFELVTKYAATPIVGFANSDIIFLENLGAALRVVLADDVLARRRKLFLTGVRKNVDVPDEVMPMDRAIDEAIWSNFTRWIVSHGTMFQDITADYFLWNRDGDWSWSSLPPFLLGGVGFDNWIVGWASATGGIETVNLTPTVDAIHVNHGKGELKLYESHFSPASTLNDEVFKKFGMIGSCDVNDLDWAVRRVNGTAILKHQ